jgi:putative ABC transport system ATP-binding protein
MPSPERQPSPPPANGESPLLEARHLTRIFGEGDDQVTALDDVSLQMNAGEFVLLIGPSGSGKSTLVAILSGLLRPTSGQVFALGHDLATLSADELEEFRLKHCGFIFQEYNLLASLNARQQLEMVLRWGEGASAHDARVRSEEMLAMLGLARLAQHMPLQLSGGEKQRVAVGRGLVKKPTFCFADEPTAALDWQRGQQVVELLRSAAHDRGVSVLVVAHDERIIAHADRVLLIHDGHLHEATADELHATRLEGAHAVHERPARR